ncbi:helix-turn-helix domain-containing protein [Actinoplanes awajinensis]|uniref:helix-turn-helix domain-containing protein n=1 Tax=Actinoplanes awajinensis TaxID=135946 RepID=UPI0009FC5C28|nr:MerR family transcriptional regulator [Actinoplanes awajinensis]
MWTMEELIDRVRAALTAEYSGAPNGRVRDLPDRRSIRWYSTIGLVDRPLGMRGRNALYGPRHLLQLVAIKRLQAAGRTLAEIQAELAGASEATLTAAARVPADLLSTDPLPPVAVARQPFWKAAPASPAPSPGPIGAGVPAAPSAPSGSPAAASPASPAAAGPAASSGPPATSDSPASSRPPATSRPPASSGADSGPGSGPLVEPPAGPADLGADWAFPATGRPPRTGRAGPRERSPQAVPGGFSLGTPFGTPEVPPPAADPPGGWPAPALDGLLTGVPLGAGVILLVPSALHLDHTDRAELALAARPLLDLLASRGLSDRRDS